MKDNRILPLRKGVGIVLLNKNNRLDKKADFLKDYIQFEDENKWYLVRK